MMLLDLVAFDMLLQPASTRKAAATARTLRVGVIFFMARFLLLLDDPGCDEDQQLPALLGPGEVLEDVAQYRDLMEEGHAFPRDRVLCPVDAADDRRAAVGDHDRRLGALHRDRGDAVDEVGEVGRVVLDLDGHDDRPLGGDLRRGPQLKGGVDVPCRYREVGHRLDGDLAALDDLGLLVVLGDDRWPGDDLAVAARFQGGQGDVDAEGVEDVGEGEAEGRVEGRRRQVDGVAAERSADALGDDALGDHRPVDEDAVRKLEVGRVAVELVGDALEAPLDAEVADERGRGLDDAGLDRDLGGRRIDDRDELLEEVELVADLGDEQGVGPVVDDDLTAGRDLGPQERGDVLGLRIGQGDRLDHDRAGQLLALREPALFLFFPRQDGDGGDAEDVAFDRLAHLVLLEDDVEGLVPGDVLEVDRCLLYTSDAADE